MDKGKGRNVVRVGRQGGLGVGLMCQKLDFIVFEVKKVYVGLEFYIKLLNKNGIVNYFC